jgi:hypothetical protein
VSWPAVSNASYLVSDGSTTRSANSTSVNWTEPLNSLACFSVAAVNASGQSAWAGPTCNQTTTRPRTAPRTTPAPPTARTPERTRWRAQLDGLRELGIKFLPDSEWVSLLRASDSEEHEVILNFPGMDGYDNGGEELSRANAPDHGGLLMGPALSPESLYRYCEMTRTAPTWSS